MSTTRTRKTNSTNGDTSARKRTRKPKQSNEPRTLSSVVNAIATTNDADATKTGKRVRAYIRGHDADLRKQFNWPPDEKSRADGNRYPPMPRECADALIGKLARSSQ